MCDPPGVVGVEPSVVLYLLHPRSAGLALPLWPDVRFTACASVQNYKYEGKTMVLCLLGKGETWSTVETPEA